MVTEVLDVDLELDRYITDTFVEPDPLLEELAREAAKREIPAIQIHDHEAKTIQLLLRAIGARRGVEIGTCFGYSAIWWARSIPTTGCLVAIEKVPEYHDLARDYLDRAGLLDRVDLRLGEAEDVLVSLEDAEPFDFVFIDANWDEYPDYLEWALAHVRVGGLILSHNAHFFGFVVLDPDDPSFEDRFRALSEEAYEDYLARDSDGKEEFLRALRAVRGFNSLVASDKRLTSTLIPTTEGIAVSLVSAA